MEGLGMNLDDGELWIPSDILPSNEVHQNRPIAPATVPIQDRSRQIGHFNPLNPNHPSVFTSPVPQRLGVYGVAQYAVPTPTPNGCYGLTVGPNMVDHGRYNYVSGSTYQTPKLGPWPMPVNMPVQTPEAQRFKETGLAKNGMPVHSQQQNYFVPIQGNGYGYGTGYPISTSTSSGTGVFFPRSLGSFNASTSNNNRRTKKGVVAPKKGASKKHEPRKKVDEKRYDYQQPSSSEVALPKDWSYW